MITQLQTVDFQRIANLAREHTGIQLEEGKLPMVQARLSKRLRHLKATSVTPYLDFVETADGVAERMELISLLTTNVTGFFREPEHFDFVRDHIGPELKCPLDNGQRVRMWSAGCSNGSEVFSLAMTLFDVANLKNHHDIRFLGTDIDVNILNVAKAARYHEDLIGPVETDARERHFTKSGENEGWMVKSHITNLTRFKHLNLLDEWPMQGQFDLVMCRNVVIYFDDQTRAQVLRRLAKRIRAGGWLMIGHSERLPPDLKSQFHCVATTTFQKTVA